MSKLTSCFNCNERTLGCHSKCEKYLEYKAKLKERNAKARKAHDANSDYYRVRGNSYRKEVKLRHLSKGRRGN